MYTLRYLTLAALPFSLAQETVYGVYIFHRHGDRTPKSLAPTNLTQLGYQEVYTSGEYYRTRYVASDASFKVTGLNPNTVKLSQISITAPQDNVLQSSAQGFLQGLYPPVETTQTLRNGTVVSAPFGGYQIVPINLVTSGTGSEDNGWLQDASGCQNAQISSNNYFLSQEYRDKLNATRSFYQDLVPVVNRTFAANYTNFKNAYTVFDLINVAEIHNATIQSDSVLTNETLFQIRTLADSHEFGLAYNASEPGNARAMPGMQLAGEILKFLNNTIKTNGASKIGIQFGAYASFLSYFGLANLTVANGDFYGVPDYASSMAFELFANSPSSGFPAASDLRVRFLFHNGTASNSSEPTVYPLFGGSETSIPWTTFNSKMNSIAVSTTEQWCHACGNTTGTCAGYASGSSSTGSTASGSGSNTGSGGISKAVAGVIGAMVTLAVILGLEALVMLVGGFRLIHKKKMVGQGLSPATSAADIKA
ncbi:phosphoglycerate mutase-like protein [Venturia nashicola]|uniref:Phosphoglycerate mutase-like protein n=1 Tax=Venturia nashicola TaxID=86259 RepID=A0A4Z1P4U1_9PEZI|nr:phosphoglycerate mutase-like protein [Venturia nashicola]TLD23389.1 phosphoglycerate mutase-like protein [Venturia nashicola]